MATLWETLAFTFRAISAKNQQSDGIYLVFQIFILLAPLWINAFAYMTLGRMIYFFHPSRSLFRVPATTVAAVFVLLDVCSFVIQLIGGGMASPSATPQDLERGLNIYMGGIGLQQFFIVVFSLLCIAFQSQMLSRSPGKIQAWGFVGTSWGPLLCVLYLSLVFVSIRVIYRLVEFSGGLEHDSPLNTQEAYFYVLEAGPMFLAIAGFNIVHPGRVITGPNAEMPGFVAYIKNFMHRRKGRESLEGDSSDGQQLMLKTARVSM
ncbi:hypothetical protein S40288_05177 [Stachybotrys chartarum IBT 40288]|nr:hypothetical protein S40288_05177 [Stachybotrys chartarum IBT 40288]